MANNYFKAYSISLGSREIQLKLHRDYTLFQPELLLSTILMIHIGKDMEIYRLRKT